MSRGQTIRKILTFANGFRNLQPCRYRSGVALFMPDCLYSPTKTFLPSILWVSVSYITLLSRRNQDIKAPDIRPFQASYLVVLGVKYEMKAAITESVRQKRFVATVSGHIKTEFIRQTAILPSVPVSQKRKISVKNKSGCEGYPSQPLKRKLSVNYSSESIFNRLLIQALSNTS